MEQSAVVYTPITAQMLHQHTKLYEELHKLQFLLNENVKTVQDRFSNNEHPVKRKKKDSDLFERTVKLTEKILWQEYHYLGRNSQAGKLLQSLYPEIFNMQDEEKAKVEEIRQFEFENFGFALTQMTPDNLIRIIEAMVDFKVKKYVKKD